MFVVAYPVVESSGNKPGPFVCPRLYSETTRRMRKLLALGTTMESVSAYSSLKSLLPLILVLLSSAATSLGKDVIQQNTTCSSRSW